jgi:hypothetical protein
VLPIPCSAIIGQQTWALPNQSIKSSIERQTTDGRSFISDGWKETASNNEALPTCSPSTLSNLTLFALDAREREFRLVLLGDPSVEVN